MLEMIIEVHKIERNKLWVNCEIVKIVGDFKVVTFYIKLFKSCNCMNKNRSIPSAFDNLVKHAIVNYSSCIQVVPKHMLKY